MKPRHRSIVSALKDLGGRATLRQIAEKTGLSVNGVSQSMGAIDVVKYSSGKSGDAEWELIESESNQPRLLK